MKLVIFGNGFVGKTIADSLEQNTSHNIVRIDPQYFDTEYNDNADGVILCLPTPTINGNCDDSIIVDVLSTIGNDIPVLLKSTVTPDLMSKYPANVTYCPEFLRAAHAAKDWAAQKQLVLGGSNTDFWKNIFSYLNTTIIVTDRTTASMTKYMHNVWLATKVAFFHDIYNSNSYNHEHMICILSLFENIGPSHMMAPNSEGKLGYSGHCFPKDVEAFYNFTDNKILKAVLETNKDLQSK